MSECEKYQEMISALLDGELSKSDAVKLRDHLRQCTDCRQTYKDFAAVSNYTQMLPDEAPFALASRVMIQTERQPAPAKPVEPEVTHHLSPIRIIFPIAAACLLLIVGFTAVKFMRIPGKTQSETAQISESVEFDTAGVTADSDTDGPSEPVMLFDAEIPEDSKTVESQNTADLLTYMIPDELGSEFESLTQVGDAPTQDPSSLTILCYAEYRGVVYEFLTDENQSNLYWMDAAEGTEAIYSGRSVSDLNDVLDKLS